MATDNLQIATSRAARGQTILALNGPLNIHTVFKFQEALRAEVSPAVIVDFSAVPYIDSAGIGCLVGAQVSRDNSGRRLVLVGTTERVRTSLGVTKVEQIFTYAASVEQARVLAGGTQA